MSWRWEYWPAGVLTSLTWWSWGRLERARSWEAGPPTPWEDSWGAWCGLGAVMFGGPPESSWGALGTDCMTEEGGRGEEGDCGEWSRPVVGDSMGMAPPPDSCLALSLP